MLPGRPGHHVGDAGPDLVIAARAAVTLEGLRAGHCPDQPLAVNAALRLRPARCTHHRRRGGAATAACEVTARHHDHGNTGYAEPRATL